MSNNRKCLLPHTSDYERARCAFPWAGWVEGDGPFALVRACGPGSVSLRETARDLDLANERCGPWCTGDHRAMGVRERECRKGWEWDSHKVWQGVPWQTT